MICCSMRSKGCCRPKKVKGSKPFKGFPAFLGIPGILMGFDPFSEDLRRIFSKTEQEKINDNVYYAERPLNGDFPDCPNCPVFGSWRDNRVDITNP
jgi:hypothetical protein